MLAGGITMKTGTLALALLVSASSLFAARSSGPSSAPSAMSPQDSAGSFYQSGERRLDKAAKLAAEIKAAADPQAATKLQGKLDKTLEGAVADFKRAVNNDPNMYSAYSEMGFALRKLGRYEESLAAYDTALGKEPGFSPAIEYRAEAHLALNRIDEARQAYLMLFSGDRARADLLLNAMKSWVAERRTNAAGVDAKQLDTFAAWVAQRETIHAQTPAVASTANIRTW
jgi:tetratricopeptide (TPR) repeat protein